MIARAKMVLIFGISTTIALAGEPSPVTAKKSLTLDGAKAAIEAATAEARRVSAPGAGVAIVDDGGNVICVERLDGTFAAAWRISIGKARTAAAFGKPTSFFEKVIKEGRTPMLALEDFTPLQGGVPIVVDGSVVGAIGVSGASSAQQDEELANVGAAAVLAALTKNTREARADVVHIDGDAVSAAFAKGETLVEGETQQFKVNASRRDDSGMAEVHLHDTDIFHILGGSATLVTGGVLSGTTTIADSDEIRGTAIEGGESHSLSTGDVVVVPKGVPHWFREVYSPLIYYVVKVR